MKENSFIKKLTLAEQNEIIRFILSNFSFNDANKFKNFYNVILDYVKNVRRDVNTLKRNISDIITLFFTCGYTNDALIEMLMKEPSLLHEEKENMFWKLLILGRVYNPKTKRNLREEDVIYNPRILRISLDVLYARIKYLESDEGKEYLRNYGFLTKRQITKITHEEFLNSYGKTKEELIKLYPFNEQAKIDIISWPENQLFLEFFLKNKSMSR